MAKWYGQIGFATVIEMAPGVVQDQITEKSYYGELNRLVGKRQAGEQINDELNVANTLSILADPFANDNLLAMRYVTFMGAKWKIVSVEALYPRLNLTIGGVYNG